MAGFSVIADSLSGALLEVDFSLYLSCAEVLRLLYKDIPQDLRIWPFLWLAGLIRSEKEAKAPKEEIKLHGESERIQGDNRRQACRLGLMLSCPGRAWSEHSGVSVLRGTG
jgi:hypothetical protein